MAPIANLTVKLSAQIAEFQGEFREATRATQQFQKDFEGTATKVSKLGDLIGTGMRIAFGAVSINAIKNWAASTIDAASRVDDLSKKIGVSSEAIQRWSHAAELSGASIDTVDRALSFMNKTLAEGDKSTIKALDKAGLSFQEIRSMRPEDAFNAIAKAIQLIPDPMTQAQVAMQLFGRTGQDLLPAIKDGFADVAAGARVMSDETIKRLDAAGDAWTKLGHIVKIHSGEMIAATMAAAEQATASWRNFFEFVKAGAINSFLQGRGGPVVPIDTRQGFIGPRTDPKVEEERRRKAIDDGLKATKMFEGQADAHKKAQGAAEAHAKAVERLRDSWLGVDAVNKLNDITAAFQGQIPLQQLSTDKQRELNVLVKDAIDAHERLGKSVPQVWREIYAATFDYANLVPEIPPAIQGITEEMARLGSVAAITIPQLQVELIGTRIKAEDLAGEFFKVGKKGSESMLTLRQGIGDLANALSNLANIAGGSFGAVASGVASVVGALDAAIKGVDAFKAGSAAFKAGDTLAGIAGMASGIMGIVSAAIAAGKAIAGIWNAFDRNKGRDLVEDFAGSFGGFDRLHKELLLLGDAGEALWIKLTQGVGRNNPEQAARVIEEVEAALAKYKSAQDAANVTTEAGAQATIETAAQAAKALDEVNERLGVNRDAWAAWSADVTGFLQKLADDIRALPLPGPGGTMGGSTGSRSLNLGSGGSASPAFSGSSVSSGTTQNIDINLDGETIARKTVRYFPSELSLNGV